MTFNIDRLFNDRNNSYVKNGTGLIDFGGQTGAGYIARNVSENNLDVKAYKLCRARMNNLGVDKKASLVFTKEENSTDGRIINVATKVLSDRHLTTSEKLDVVYGEVTHESAHVMYTPFKSVRSIDNIHHSILNILEDERIERKIVDDYVGYSDCLASIKNYYFDKLYKTPDNENDDVINNTIGNMINLVLLLVRYPKHVEDTLKMLEECVKNYKVAKSNIDYRKFLEEVTEILEDYPTSYKQMTIRGKKIYDLISRYHMDNFTSQNNKSISESTLNSIKSSNGNEQVPKSVWEQVDEICVELLKEERESILDKLKKIEDKPSKYKDEKAEKYKSEYWEKLDDLKEQLKSSLRWGEYDASDINRILSSSTAKKQRGSASPIGIQMKVAKKSTETTRNKQVKDLESNIVDWRDSVAGNVSSSMSKEIVPTVNEDGLSHHEYGLIKRDCKYNIKRLSNALRVQMTAHNDIKKSQRNGKLDKLVDGYIGDEFVYSRKSDGTKEKLSICLLIDESGSMNSWIDDVPKYEIAKKIAIMFNEALKTIDDLELFIYGFDSKFSDNLYIYKENNINNDVSLTNITGRGANADYVSIMDSAQRVRKHTDSKCLFIVLSDGLPCASYDTKWVNQAGGDAVAETKWAVDKISSMGFVPMQIGIGTKYKTNEMFKDWVQFKNFNQMTNNIVRLIRTRIQRLLINN